MTTLTLTPVSPGSLTVAAAAAGGAFVFADYIIYGDGINSTALPLRAGLATIATGEFGAVLQSALTNLKTTAGNSVGTIVLAGSHAPTTIPSIPPVATGTTPDPRYLKIIGLPGSKITASSGGKRFLDFGRTADYDWFGNLVVEGIVFDRNNLTDSTNTHVLIGNLVGGAWSRRVNFANIEIRRCKTLNVPMGSSAGYQNISLAGYHLASSEGTQTSITNILVEDCEFGGGNYGVAMVGSAASVTSGQGVNVWLDRIHIKRCKHDCGVVPTAFAGAANVQLGGYGFGESCVIEDFYGYNSSDVGFEIDAFQSATVERCVITDSWNAAFGSYCFRSPRDINSQIYRYRDCRVRSSAVVPTSGHPFIGWECGSPNVPATQYAGTVLLDGCAYDNATSYFAANGMAISCRAGSGFRRLVLRDFEYSSPSVSQTLSADAIASVIYLDPSAVAPFTLIYDDVRVKVAGATTLNGHTFGANLFHIAGTDDVGADVTVEGRGYVFDYNMTGVAAGSTMGLRLGPT